MEIYNNTKIAVRNLDLYYGEKTGIKRRKHEHKRR